MSMLVETGLENTIWLEIPNKSDPLASIYIQVRKNAFGMSNFNILFTVNNLYSVFLSLNVHEEEKQQN